VYAALVVFAILWILQRLAMMSEEGVPRYSIGDIILMATPQWIVWMIIAPGVIAAIKAIQRTHLSGLLRALLHIPVALATTLVHTALTFTMLHTLHKVPADLTFVTGIAQGLAILSPVNAIVYGLIAWMVAASDADRRLQEQRTLALRLSEQLVVARLDALRMQLQPHFFFNAMNSIAMLVRRGEKDQAVRTVATLSDLLREVLQEYSEHETTLGDEISFVKRYLSIEQVRFGDRLRLDMDVPTELLPLPVPRLILQPIVENAVRHGLEKSSAAGHIAISARRTDGRLRISVMDDGPGTDTPEAVPTSAGGVGLSNTRSRLDLIYGSGATLTLSRRPPPETGTSVALELPLRDAVT
jgi:sensor histidine kinase YesM